MIFNDMIIILLAPPKITSIFSTPPYVMGSFMLNIPIGYSEVALTCLASTSNFSMYPLHWYRKTLEFQELVQSNMSIKKNLISTELIFSNGFQFYDSGEYLCSAGNEKRNSTSTVFLILEGNPRQAMHPCTSPTTDFFRIQVLDTNCKEWNLTKKQEILNFFTQSILSVLSNRCPVCNINEDYISLPIEPTCSNGAAIFRGMFSAQLLTQDLYCAFSSWHQSGPAIALDDGIYLVDYRCSLSVTSLMAPACHEKSEIDNYVSIGFSTASGFLVVAMLVASLTYIFYKYVVYSNLV